MHVYNVKPPLSILSPQMFKYSYLFLRLSVEPLLIAHDFERNVCARLVIICLYDLTKTTLADNLHLMDNANCQFPVVDYNTVMKNTYVQEM